LIFHSTYSRPILLAGNGIRSSGSVDLVHQFAEKTNIPILTTMNAVDIAQDDIHLGFIGTHGNRVANMILNECDLIISIGARLSIRQVGRDSKNFAPNANLIRCDIDEYELSRNIKNNEEKYHTDCRDFLELLLLEDIKDYSDWKKRCFEAKRILDAYDKQPGNYAVEMIASMLPENPIVSVDVGMNQCWTAQSLQLKGDKGRIHISGGYGIMGCSIPFAIGSSISTNNGKVFCITGDGGLQMNIQELETIRREKLPIKIFVLNNKVLGKISETQYFEHGKRLANTSFSGGYSVPDFTRISEAYGIRARKLESYEELRGYGDLIEDNEPCLFDISLPEESFLTPKIRFDTGVVYPEIEEKISERVKSILHG